MAKILVVEDDRMVSVMVRDCLESQNHTVETLSDGAEGLAYLAEASYDLLILDCGLPGLSGVDVCKEFRKKGGRTPILFLTARSAITDKAAGFDAGADDYLTKPFHPDELLMRVRALLRRQSVESTDEVTVGDLVIEPRSGRVLKDGVEVKLQRRELALLEFLARHPDTFFSTEALLERVWESDTEATEIALRSCVAKLRRKLDKPGDVSVIESVRGMGYKFPKRG